MKTQLLIVLIISLAIWHWYTIMVWIKFGITHSISESYRYFEGWKKVWFTLWAWGVAATLIWVSSSIIGFCAGGCLALVGAAPACNDRWQNTLHMIGTYGAIGLGMLMLVIFGLWWLVVIFALFTLLTMGFDMTNHTWWLENVAYYVIIAGLFIEKILN
jgi:hypothetical protein